MRCNIEVHDVTTVMAEHDKDIENAKCGSRDGEEINSNQTVCMVFEKGPPGLRRRLLMTGHVFGHSGLGYLYTEHLQFTMDTRRAPTNVVT